MNQVVQVVVCFVYTVKAKLGFVFIQVTTREKKKIQGTSHSDKLCTRTCNIQV